MGTFRAVRRQLRNRLVDALTAVAARLRSESTPLDTAAKVWSEAAQRRAVDDADGERERRREWVYHPAVATWIEQRGGCTFPDWVCGALGTPGRAMVSIGCGTATTELDLLKQGTVESVVLVDVASGALDVARRRASEMGILDRVTFVEREISPAMIRSTLAGSDVVFVSDALHHLADVPGVITAIHDCLAPGGTFVGRDYVGPDRFAFEPEVRAATNDAYLAVPSHLRGDWPELPAPDPQQVALFDPTEALEASRIRASLAASFPAREVREIGGAIVHPVWYGVDHDAMHAHPDAVAAIDRLTALDEHLTDSGAVPSYFIWFRATRR